MDSNSADDDSGNGIWTQERLAKVKIKVFRGHNAGVRSCCYLGDSSTVVSGGDDKTLIIWDANSGVQKLSMTGHKDKITCCRASPDGRKLASTGFDKYLIVWDTVTGQPMLQSMHEGMVMSCDISYDGKYMLSCTDLDNSVTIWDMRQQKSIKTMKYHSSTVTSCRFARNSYRFCTTGMDVTSRVVEMQDYRDNTFPHVVQTFSGHINMISSCDFSPDERWVCTGSWDKSILIWDVNAGTYRKSGPLHLSDGHDGSVSGCRFFHNGTTILSSSYDETLIVWDVNNACKKFSLQGHSGWVTDCDISKDDKNVISSSKDGTVRYWNIENSDDIPMVLQTRKSIGLRILNCKRCLKKFSIAQSQDASSVTHCVFCRLEEERGLSSSMTYYTPTPDHTNEVTHDHGKTQTVNTR